MRKLFRKMDKPLFFLTILYTILGLVMVLSASSVSAVLRYNVSTYYFFIRQLIFVVVSYIIGFVVLNISTNKYRFIAPLYLLSTIVLLGLVQIFGYVAGGAKSWIDFGFFNLQPTEFAKTALILYMATFYEKSVKKQRRFLVNLIPLVLGIIIFGLVALQPDLGGAVIIAGIVFFMFLCIPFPKDKKISFIKKLGIVCLAGVVILLYSGLASKFLNESQRQRLNFQAPCSRYIEDTGYQVCNGFIALHNGGLFGVGLGNSTQKYLYLPEAHTDFIFPILVEELGLIVGILVILGYFIMLYRILKLAKRAQTIKNQLICYGSFIFIFLHLGLNFLGIFALTPLTGVPVPFLSYGGSFSINVIVIMFVIQRVSIETNVAIEKKELAKLSSK